MNNVPLTIDQVAQIVGVSKAKLRHWELLYQVKPQRTEGNHRRYSQTQTEMLLKIKALYDEGFTSWGVKAKIQLITGESHAS
jgi:MerR family transcriptional regulator, heat shock protein HspR